jgi:sugar fermentation stimulation protein A
MIFNPPLIQGTLIRRYQRFLVDFETPDGTLERAHCPNTGSMKTCLYPGQPIWVSKAPYGSQRKLSYTWEIAQTPEGSRIGVHTGRTNKLWEEGFLEGAFPIPHHYSLLEREVTLGDSRIDFRLTAPGLQEPPFWIEVKHVTFWDDTQDLCVFPDAVSTRGQKHLEFLIQRVQEGHRAGICFLVQRPEGVAFAPAAQVDPVYAELFYQAQALGVQIFCHRVTVCPVAGLQVGQAIPVLS